MEVPRLGSNQSYSCWPASQPQQCWILNPLLKPLREARDQTFVLMDASQIRFGCATTWILNPLLNPLREARDQTFVLMDASQIRFGCATT